MYAVIMAGGRGTRFWPKSRKARPKQFLKIGSPSSLIQETVKRLASRFILNRILILTNIEQLPLVREQLPELPEENIILEPVVRDTAPCILLAARYISAIDPDERMLILPSDHHIGGQKDFLATIALIDDLLKEGTDAVTIGIKPDRPETGYGYIEAEERVGNSGSIAVRKVRSFTEKPNPGTARKFLELQRYYWNSGIFAWNIKSLLTAYATHLPEMYEQSRCLIDCARKFTWQRAVEEFFAVVKPISIDYGIMEKYQDILMVEAPFRWNDLGSWSTIPTGRTGDNQVLDGQVLAIEAKGNVVDCTRSNKLIALLGIDDCVVVDTDDALLICRKDRAQDVRRVIEELRRSGRTELL